MKRSMGRTVVTPVELSLRRTLVQFVILFGSLSAICFEPQRHNDREVHKVEKLFFALFAFLPLRSPCNFCRRTKQKYKSGTQRCLIEIPMPVPKKLLA